MKAIRIISIILLTTLITVLIIGASAYYYQNLNNQNKQDELKKQISILQKQIFDLNKLIPIKNQVPAVKNSIIKDETASQTLTFPAVTTCAFWDNRAYGKINIESIEYAAGTLDIRGNIISRVEDASWKKNKKVTKIYLALSKPADASQQIFYNYYMAMAKKGNTINRFNNEQLLFRLGVKENSKLISSADISNNLRDHLITLIDKTNTIDLKITIPIYDGGGVSDKFSFACNISE